MILGSICARGGSRGLPRKAIKILAGKPLIQWTIEQALSCGALDKIVVSTDDKQISIVASEVSQQVVIDMRPEQLAQDTTPKWDVFRYLAGKYPFDVLVDLDIGCPLRSPDDITTCINKLKFAGDVIATAYPSERNPYFNMVHESGSIVCQSRGLITRRQDAPRVYSLSPSVFAINPRILFMVEHWSQADLRIVVVPRERGIDIDTIEDWNYVAYLKGKQ